MMEPLVDMVGRPWSCPVARFSNTLVLIQLLAVVSLFATPAAAQAPSQPAASSALPADPWPRDISIAGAAVLVYQPQVNSWNGNQLDFRVAMAIKPTGATSETFGSAFVTARTQVDKVARTVVFENLTITKSDFPTLPDHGSSYTAALQASMAKNMRSISLDRLEASLTADGIKPPAIALKNEAPTVIVSYSPAILVPIDGAPVWKPLPENSRFQRVINTQALILKGGLEDQLFLHVYDGWLTASGLAGPWTLSMQAAARHGRRRQGSRQGRQGRHADRPGAGPAEAVAEQRRADDLCRPGPDRADRVQGPARFRSGHRHPAALGLEHHRRRVRRDQQQPLFRADGRALVRGPGADRAVDLRRQRRLAGRFRSHSAVVARQRGAAHGSRNAAGA